MKILFVCNAGVNRSRTAAELWKNTHPKDEVKYAGIINIDKPDLFFWADKIVCFEERIRKRILELVFDDNKVYLKLEVWNIPDVYNYMDKELVKILEGIILGKEYK